MDENQAIRIIKELRKVIRTDDDIDRALDLAVLDLERISRVKSIQEGYSYMTDRPHSSPTTSDTIKYELLSDILRGAV